MTRAEMKTCRETTGAPEIRCQLCSQAFDYLWYEVMRRKEEEKDNAQLRRKSRKTIHLLRLEV